jgi:hypothetical protein
LSGEGGCGLGFGFHAFADQLVQQGDGVREGQQAQVQAAAAM